MSKHPSHKLKALNQKQHHQRHKSPPSTYDSLPDLKNQDNSNLTLNLSQFYNKHSSRQSLLDYTLRLQQNCIPVLQAHLQEIIMLGPEHSGKLELARPIVDDLQTQVGEQLQRIHLFRKLVEFLRVQCYIKEKQAKRKRQRKRNLQMVLQQFRNLDRIKSQLQNLNEYEEILPMLRHNICVPYACYRQLCLSRTTKLMLSRIGLQKTLKCNYEWNINDLNTLSFCVQKLLQVSDQETGIKNLSQLCRRYIQILAHIRINPSEMEVIHEELGEIFKQKLISQSLSKTYPLYTESLSIMQYSTHTIELLSEFCSSLKSERNRNYDQAIRQIKMLERLEEEDLRTWLKFYQYRFGWLKSDNIQREFQEIRTLITKKIIRPLLIDQQLSMSGGGVDSINDRKYHLHRLFLNCKEMFHELHPAEKSAAIDIDPWIPFTTDLSKAKVKDKKISKLRLKVQFVVFSNSFNHDSEQRGIIEYLSYGQILHFLWNQNFYNSQIMHLWAVLIGQYTFRLQPNSFLKMQETKHFMLEEISSNYNQLVSQSILHQELKEACKNVLKWRQSGDAKKRACAEATFDRVYSFICGNKVTAWKKKAVDQMAVWVDRNLDCFHQIQNIRRKGYRLLFQGCAICEKEWK